MQHANANGTSTELACMSSVATCERVACILDRAPVVGSVLDSELYALASIIRFEIDSTSAFVVCPTADIRDAWLARFPQLGKLHILVSSEMSEIRAAILAFSVAVALRKSNNEEKKKAEKRSGAPVSGTQDDQSDDRSPDVKRKR